jgi:hypothetical protein
MPPGNCAPAIHATTKHSAAQYHSKLSLNSLQAGRG